MNSAANPASELARAILVGVDLGRDPDFDESLDELALLAQTAGDAAVARVVARRKAPDAALFVGSGKADEIKALVLAHQAEAVLFDQALSPIQQRNLEQHLGVPVADRTALILEIFAQRARSHEGKLQVELAQLQYLATRLVRRWSHLERQKGGIGTRGGPGERQMELDRRMIDERIKQLKMRLSKVAKQRDTQRKARTRGGRTQQHRVSLVGYTNAGKSSLFNALTRAGSYSADQLFATLDTTTRSFFLAHGQPTALLSDTVGFIRDLPHKLVEAFKATLQEAADAQLLLHVIDAGSPKLHEQWAEVEKVLDEIGAADTPQIVVFNKLDTLPESLRPRVLVDEVERPNGTRVSRVWLSAHSGEGLSELRNSISRLTQTGSSLANPEGSEPLDFDPSSPSVAVDVDHASS